MQIAAWSYMCVLRKYTGGQVVKDAPSVHGYRCHTDVLTALIRRQEYLQLTMVPLSGQPSSSARPHQQQAGDVQSACRYSSSKPDVITGRKSKRTHQAMRDGSPSLSDDSTRLHTRRNSFLYGGNTDARNVNDKRPSSPLSSAHPRTESTYLNTNNRTLLITALLLSKRCGRVSG